MNFAFFKSFDPRRQTWDLSLSDPISVWTCDSPDQVIAALEKGESASFEGCFTVVALTYESAPAFDSALDVHKPADTPLAWVAIFERPASIKAHAVTPHRASTFHPRISEQRYNESIDAIKHRIEAGDTYQVNYTFPLTCEFSGDAFSWFGELGQSQGSAYSAYIDAGRYKILSHSPELFFQRTGSQLITRPMKGTYPRGRWLEEDIENRSLLRKSEKDLAENLMIVDLLRNDLGKVSTVGSVKTRDLFQVERYPSVLQMTSTVESTVKPGARLIDILRALFPCGSITGAPKIRTMEIIKELEPFPRGIYTGAIGLILPGGDCIFNVAIRTVLVDEGKGVATFGVGGGITWDSTASGEYEECAVKARFLQNRVPEFQLIETLLLEDGEYFLLNRHLQRLRYSAEYFDFPFEGEPILAGLSDLALEHPSARWRVRLLLARDGSFTIECRELDSNSDQVWKVRLASEPVNSSNVFLYHKTTNRAAYSEASELSDDLDDMTFWNERGEITESSIANIVIESDGQLWTPPRQSGLLNGTFRDELLSTGVIKERTMNKEILSPGTELFLINSVRKWIRAIIV